jgi:hypothetical protein
VCGANCTLVARSGDRCEDGAVSYPYEDCDDGNASACGTCSANCRSPQPAAAATGFLVLPAGASFVDGETFTLDDGFGNVVVFEFDTNLGISPGNVQVLAPGSATESFMRDQCINAINGQGALRITASAGGSQIVLLASDRQTSLGNVAIQETVSSASFLASGMAGGAAGDCFLGIGCVSGSDCASGFCDSGICEIAP